MRFEQFVSIKENLLNEGYSETEYKYLVDISESVLTEQEEVDLFEGELYEGVLGDLINRVRMLGLGKKLTKAKVDQALLDVDTKKKIRAGIPPEKKDILLAATETKTKASEELVKGIVQKIDDLAADSAWLKKVATKLKTEAAIKSSQILIKAASKEEAKELKLAIQKKQERIANAEEELRDYETGAQEKAKKESKEEIEKIEDEVKELNDQIGDIGGKMKDADEEKEKLSLEMEKISLEAKVLQLKAKINGLIKIVEPEGDEKYKNLAGEKEKLVQKQDDLQKKSKDAKTEPKAEPKQEPKTEPAQEPKAEPKQEPKTEPKQEPNNEIETQKQKVESIQSEITKLKEELGKLEDTPENKEKRDALQTQITAKDGDLKKEQDKLAELQKAK